MLTDVASASPPSSASSHLDSELLPLIVSGKRIEAIKLLRERTGVARKEAKDYVDAMEVSRVFASWNQLDGGCGGVDGVRRVASSDGYGVLP